VAIIGCGAVTSSSHLPVLAGHERVRVTALVDPDRERATRLAALYGMPAVFTSLEDVDQTVADAALVATPAFLHTEHSIALMRRGLHVLVEKPMALTLKDAEQMVAVSRQTDRVLTVGLFRRLIPAIRLFRAALDAGEIGELVHVDAEVGSAYTWPLTTMAGMRKEQNGGGCLADMGPHLLDLLVYLANGTPELIEYADNGSSGIETEALVKFVLRTPRGLVPARAELSRTRTLRNTIRVQGQSGTIEWSFGDRYKLQVQRDRVLVDTLSATPRPYLLEARWRDEVEQIGYEGFRTQFDDWINAIESGVEPQLSAVSVLPTVKLMEECYERRVPTEEPWFTESLVSPASAKRPVSSTAAPRVLIAGASGFIGCRLSERLHFGSDWQVRALIRTPGRAVRLGRMPIEFAVGDLTSETDLAKALEGCDAVVHSGVGTSWKRSERIETNVKGTKNLVDAAMKAGVKRFVHLSTIALYGDDVTGTITEDTPARPKKGWDYAESKYAAEQIVLEAAARGLPAVVLRVAVVYGPHNMTVTVRPLQSLVENRLVLVECADVASNTIYVDNLCAGIQLALEAPSTVNGQTFMLSDDDGYTWGDYFGYFAESLGLPLRHESKAQHPRPVAPSTMTRWLRSTRDVVLSPETKGLAKRIYNAEPWGNPARWFIDTFPGATQALKNRIRPEEGLVYRPVPSTSSNAAPFVVNPIHASVSAAKARSVLGYEPVVSRQRAMELTLAWARYARLVPDQVDAPRPAVIA
jgi:predicted dehydrogenase/nucleoside-diphosphate-sugar epimerase